MSSFPKINFFFLGQNCTEEEEEEEEEDDGGEEEKKEVLDSR